MAEAGAGDAGAGGQGEGGAGAGDAGQGAGGGAAAPWHGIAEADGAAYVANKGWQAPADVVRSYREAEKLIGRDPSTLLVMPRSDDPVALRSVQAKLGMPETPDKYEFAKPPEGLSVDEGYVGWARNTFHKAGLTNGQVKELSAAHNEYVAGILAQQEKDYQTSVAADKKTLLNEWKGGHDRMLNVAQAAAKALDFTPEMIDAIERSVGYAGSMKFFAQLGQRLSEDGFVSGGDSKPLAGMMTPEEAKAQWESKKLDTNFMAALQDRNHPGHKEAQRKQTELFGIMYPT